MTPLDAASWQPIETAPKDVSAVVVLLPCGLAVVAYWENGRWSSRPYSEMWDDLGPTHWMPIPPAPKDTP